MNTTYPVGDGRLWEVGDVGVCREFPRTEPTVPTLSTAFSIKHPPGKAAHPPAEDAAVAAVVKDSLNNCLTKLEYQIPEQWKSSDICYLYEIQVTLHGNTNFFINNITFKFLAAHFFDKSSHSLQMLNENGCE